MKSVKKAASVAALSLFLLTLSNAAVRGGEKPVDNPVTLSHAMEVTVDIGARKIAGRDSITLKKGSTEIRLLIRSGSSIDRVELSGSALEFTVREMPEEMAVESVVKLPPAEAAGGPVVLDVSFHGAFPGADAARENIKRGVAYVEDGVIGTEGVFLPSSSLWYPQEENGLSLYDVTVRLPEGYTSIMEGELVRKHGDGNNTARWKTERMLDGMDLVAAKYVADKETYRGVDIYTLFFKKDPELSRLYIEKTKGYLDLYREMIGPYPFKKFAVVENFLPTGYGMPSFTLLGSTVLRLPFIPDTSLGHEIAHNWWGNSVFVDSSRGNWSEAITTYTADYLYERRKGEARAKEFRFSKLLGYRNFAGATAIALKDFTDSTSTASRAVGYNKGSMVFNMLENLLGASQFNRGIKEFYKANAFKKASWSDIEAAFEKSSGRDLKWFFDEWVKRPGGPALSISGVEVKGSPEGYAVSFDISQDDAEPYILDLPVVFTTKTGEARKDIRLDKKSSRVSVILDSRPVSLEVDPGYQSFRILSDQEVPASFAGFFGDKDGVIIVPNEAAHMEKYIETAKTLSGDFAIKTMTDSDNMKDYLKEKSVFVFGGKGENRLYSAIEPYFSKELIITPSSYEIGGKTFGRNGSILAVAVKNPFNPSKTVCFFTGDADREKIIENGKRMRYFSDAGYIVFKSDGKAEKGTFPGRPALRYDFAE